MKYRDFLLGGVALTALLAPSLASAQQTGDNFSWNGAYIGADVGLGMGSTVRQDVLFPPAIPIGNLGSEAATGGVFGGYDFEVAPGLVFGVEAGIDFFNAEANSTVLTGLESYEFRSLGAAHAGVRAGVELAPRTLMYGRLAYAAIHAQTTEAIPGPAKEGFVDGYQAGIGIETEVVDNVTLRVEGTYTRAVDSFIHGDTDNFSEDFSHLGASVGVAYRFGADSRGSRADLTPTRSWFGGYVGVLGGGTSVSSVDGGFVGQEGPVSDIAGEYGAYAGVNLQVGDQWVVGVEGELSKYEANFDAVNAAGVFDFGTSDHRGQVSARLGYLVNPDTLVYGRAGYGLMHINPDLTFAAPGTESEYIRMMSAGVGIETMVNEHALVRAEGLYSTAVDDDFRFTDGGGDYYLKPTSVEARVGAAFMF